jgi:hypothetical protein
MRWILGLLCALTFAAPTLAQVDPAKLPAAKKAAADFVTMAKGSENTGQVPRERDPAVRTLLETVCDARDVDAAKSISFQALSPLSDRLMTGLQVGTVYMLAGTGATEIAKLATDQAAIQKVDQNTVRFAPELGRFFDFHMKMQGGIIDAVMVRLATAKPEELSRPNFQSGLADVRGGSARSVSGVIDTLTLEGMSDEWRRERLAALAQIAPKLAELLQPNERTDLQQVALDRAHVISDAQVKSALHEFAKVVGAS